LQTVEIALWQNDGGAVADFDYLYRFVHTAVITRSGLC
jgi:hypothetical protein